MVTWCFLVLYHIIFCIVVILILSIHAVSTDLVFFPLCLNHTVNWGTMVICRNGYDSIAAKARSLFTPCWKAVWESPCNRLHTDPYEMLLHKYYQPLSKKQMFSLLFEMKCSEWQNQDKWYSNLLILGVGSWFTLYRNSNDVNRLIEDF